MKSVLRLRTLAVLAGLLPVLLLPSVLGAADAPFSPDDEAKLHIGIREVPAVMALPGKDEEAARYAKACAGLEKRLRFPAGLLQARLKDFATELIGHAETPALERAGALFVLGRFAEAETVAVDAAKERGSEAKGLELAGRCAAQLGNLDRALEHYRATAEQVSEQDDPIGWSAIQRDVAIVDVATGKFAEAEALWRKVLEIHLARLKPEHPDILSARNVLAATLIREGKNAEAAEQYRAVLAVLERTRGADSPDTVRARQNLERALKSAP